METDLSHALYQKIRSLENKMLEVTTKDKMLLRGKFIGFFPGDTEAGEEYIVQWHFTDEQDKNMCGMDAFGFRLGSLVLQSEISQVKFLQDNSIMKF